MDPRFGNLIWTHHALKRLKERRLSQADAWATWRRPNNSRYAKNRGAWVYYRTFGNQKIEMVAKKNDQNQWVVLSVWSKKIRKHNNHQFKSLSAGSLINKVFAFLKIIKS